jgi:adenylate cyclase
MKWCATRVQCGQPAPDVGAGIASGPVLSGIVGDGKRLEYTVIGDAVNLAAKPEKHNNWSAHGPLRHMPPMRRP